MNAIFQDVTAERIAAERLRPLTLADCAAAPPRGYIVKHLIGPRDLALIFAAPGAGKSVLAPYLAHCVASVRPAFGHRVRACPVLYIAAEDGSGMRHRMAALRDLYGDTDDLRLIAEPCDLFGDPDARREPPDLALIRQRAAAMKAGLIVVDTVHAAFPGHRENEGQDMSRVCRHTRALGTPTEDMPDWQGAAVALVHHVPRSDASRPRGHGALEGDADVTLRIEGEAGGLRTVSLGKNRNGTALASFAFTIKSHTLGIDDDGDAITAPVAEEAEALPRPSRSPITGQPALALRYLHEAVAAEGGPLPTGPGFPPAGTPGITLDRWREQCRNRALADGDDAAHRQAFHRARTALTAKGAVATATHGGTVYAWPTRRDGTA
jgi:hypothetical protein